MSALQLFVSVFGLVALGITIWAALAIIKSRQLRWKPLWMIGTLFAFVGFTINWSNPGDLFMWFGFQIPFFSMHKLSGSPDWIVKIGAPIIAIVALAQTHRLQAEDH